MPEVLVEFDTTLLSSEGTRWVPRACGGIAPDGLWEGWIEFTAADESIDPIRTGRETEQPKRDDLMYWAQGLTQTYLEGALGRALEPRPASTVRAKRIASEPHFDAPAPRLRADSSPTVPRPVLNPFEVYRQGVHILVRELSALDVARLREIAVGFRLLSVAAADGKSREDLTTTILAAVRQPPAEPARKGRDFVL